jgi:cation:H+ antiporter
MTLITLGYLAGGLLLLVAGGEAVVRGAASLGMRIGLSALATGLTIVAFGTSAPELVVNLGAAARGVSDLAVGNVVGSNIANIGLVLGLSALVRPLTLDVKVIRNDIWFMIGTAVLAGIFLAADTMTRWEGVILVALVIAYTAYNLRAADRAGERSKRSFEDALPREHQGWWIDLALVLGGLVGLAVGGQLFVNGAVELATALGMSTAVIGLTVVAIGTSLPELATTAIAAYRGHGDMAIGNVVGSNIFNILSVLGITAVVFPVSRGDIGNADLAMFLGSALVLLRFITTGSRMDRWEGAVLFVGFCAYLGWRLA